MCVCMFAHFKFLSTAVHDSPDVSFGFERITQLSFKQYLVLMFRFSDNAHIYMCLSQGEFGSIL